MQIEIYASESGLSWFWRISVAGGPVASSEDGDGEYCAFATRESALADACKVATRMFPVKADFRNCNSGWD